MRALLAALLLCLVPLIAEARPSPYRAVDAFAGDRWLMAQGGSAADVTRTMRCPAPCSRAKPKAKKKPRRPVAGLTIAHVPLPRVRPQEPMDEDQAAAYRVIAALFAGAKIVIGGSDEPAQPKNIFQGFRDEILKAAKPPKGRSLIGIVKPLAAKVMQIASLCPGTVVISTVRPGARVRGSGRPSLHRSGKAVDIAGPYRCIYAALKGFPGGVSTDAHRVRHVHLSWDPKGREWGRRFAHYRGGAKRTRHARYRGKQIAFRVAS